MKDKEYIGVVEAAKLLGINYRTLLKRDEIYNFEKKIVKNRVFYSKKDLENFKNFDKK